MSRDGVEELAARRVARDGDHGCPVDGEGDEDVEVVRPGDELARAVERIRDPDALVGEPRVVVDPFLRQQPVVREDRRDRPADGGVAREVRDGHGRTVELGIGREALGRAVDRQDRRRAGTGSRDRRPQFDPVIGFLGQWQHVDVRQRDLPDAPTLPGA